jgi:uncharacterized protein YndB with AHSA1/START domain
MDAPRNKPTSSGTGTADCEIIITRTFDAPRELVWEAWTNPEKLVKWWGPIGFTTTIEEMDVRPGGVWKHVMHGPDGANYPNKSTFLEVVKPARIVYKHGGHKEGGPGVNFTATWLFEALGDKTQVTIHQIFPNAEEREKVVKQFNAIEGGNQTLERFSMQVSRTAPGKDRPFIIARVLKAPRDVVFKAFTEVDHMMRWWGPKGFRVLKATMDLRPGGTYHYGMDAPDGNSMWGKFVFREIVAPEKLVFINSFSDEAGGITRHPMSPTWPLEMLSTITFEAHPEGTLLTIRWETLPGATEEERATFGGGHISMNQGWSGTLEQLATYLDS